MKSLFPKIAFALWIACGAMLSLSPSSVIQHERPVSDGPGAGGGYSGLCTSDGPGAGGGYSGLCISDGPGAGGGYSV